MIINWQSIKRTSDYIGEHYVWTGITTPTVFVPYAEKQFKFSAIAPSFDLGTATDFKFKERKTFRLQ